MPSELQSFDKWDRSTNPASIVAPRRAPQQPGAFSPFAGLRAERDTADEQLRLTRETQALEREFTDLHEEAAKRLDDADLRFRIGQVALRLDKPDLARLWSRAAMAIDADRARARAALADGS